jgi:DNA-binding transcriptional ArsR family regulator
LSAVRESREPSLRLALRLRAIAHPARIELLRHLGTPRTARQLAGVLPVSRQAVAKHLRCLVQAGLVHRTESRALGSRSRRYLLARTAMHEIAEGVAHLQSQVEASHDGTLGPR